MKKIALHIIMPNQTSGPNTANRLLANSELKKDYKFCFITQTFHAGGRVNWKLIKDLKNQIKTEQPDLIHFSGMQASGFHAVLAARLAGKKNILVTIRGFSGDALNVSFMKRFMLSQIFEPLTLKLCKKFYTVCEEAAEKKMVQQNIHKYLGVIHNAAPQITIDVADARQKTRKEYGFADDDFVIGISGRMVYDKGIDYISQAITDLENNYEYKHIKFLFIGDGPYCDILKERHKKEIENGRVFVLGQMNNVIELLCGCDTFLFATLHENLSNALLEAMSVGLPVIATEIGGNVEVVKDNENGFLIPDRNAQAIVDKVILLYLNEELQKKFSLRSKQIIDEEFSQEKIYSQIKAVYDDMLKVG